MKGQYCLIAHLVWWVVNGKVLSGILSLLFSYCFCKHQHFIVLFLYVDNLLFKAIDHFLQLLHVCNSGPVLVTLKCVIMCYHTIKGVVLALATPEAVAPVLVLGFIACECDTTWLRGTLPYCYGATHLIFSFRVWATVWLHTSQLQPFIIVKLVTHKHTHLHAECTHTCMQNACMYASIHACAAQAIPFSLLLQLVVCLQILIYNIIRRKTV